MPGEQFLAKQSLFERIYWALKGRWWASILLTVIPALVISTIKLYGKELALVDDIGTLTSVGTFIVVVSFIFIVFYNSLKEYADLRLYKDSIIGQQYLERILQGVDTANDQKQRRFIEYVDHHYQNPPGDPFGAITQPQKQIAEILREIQKLFADLFGIKDDRIGLSVICHLGDNGDPFVPARINVGSEKHILGLLQQPNSGFSMFQNSNKHFHFIPNKAKSVVKGEYMPGTKDISVENVGSLVCCRIEVIGEKTHVYGVLSISTYGTYLYPEGDQRAEVKIAYQILPAFIKRLQLEMALLYIKENMSFKPS